MRTRTVAHFPRTQRSLRGQALGRQAGVIVALVFLFGGWLVWLGAGKVSLYVVSQQARVEVQRLPVPVQAPVDGQVTFADVTLGRNVEPGDPIVTLDTKPLELQRAEKEAALRTGLASLESLHAELSAEERARAAVAGVADQTVRAGQARVSANKKAADFKQKEAQIVAELRDASAISGLDALHTTADAEETRAQLAAASAQAALDTRTSTTSLRDRDARLASVRYIISQGEAETETLRAQIQTLDYEISRRTVRAPVAGTLADVMPISVGMTITSQQRLATIVPRGTVRVVAFFAPQDSIGRVRAGQRATLRVDNFPWTQFGTVGALVDQVGSEPRDGTIRIELKVTQPNSSIPMEHGLTGICEVQVERISPFQLLLRTAGQWVAPARGGGGPAGPAVARAQGS